jgi:cytochrome c-type biogenesis protein CcmH
MSGHRRQRRLGAGPLVALVVAAALALLAAAPAWTQPPARPVSEEVVHEVAAQLRCVVCQNLSVADSPSDMAEQMRAIVRERLAAGERPEQVVQYFVDRYGEWILLSPRRHGFNLALWLAPAVAVVLGIAATAAVVVTWTRRRASRPPVAPVDPAMAERIRREVEAGS